MPQVRKKENKKRGANSRRNGLYNTYYIAYKLKYIFEHKNQLCCQ